MDTSSTVNVTSVKHEFIYRQGGKRDKVVSYTFYIGDHGPFTELVPDDANTDTEFSARVMKLKTRLATLPR